MAQPAPTQTKLTTEQLFDSVGPAYEQAFANLDPQIASIKWVLSQLTSHKPAQIIDIGCGTGRPVCSSFADAGHSVLGIDISSAMISDAKAKVPNAKFEKIDIGDFKTDDGSFDAVTVYFSMIAGVTQGQIREYIKRIHAWLKPGGLFVFATVPVKGENVDITWMGRSFTASGLDADESVEWIKEVGFEVVERSESKFLPKAVEAGICSEKEVWEEPHLFVYARKKDGAAS